MHGNFASGHALGLHIGERHTDLNR
ncbi:hypothetical protein RHECNPAF_1340014 [Rhizobium etli CNPAF512]|nr:hypothetical protein RHECNPAF_1340014 [Rhizobium etli CNPAF512]